MKKFLFTTLFLMALLIGNATLKAQSPSLTGRAMAAATECIQGFDYPGLGLRLVTDIEVVGSCPIGNKYAVNISRVGHCPGGDEILCLVIAMPVARVVFDCNGQVESVECFN